MIDSGLTLLLSIVAFVVVVAVAVTATVWGVRRIARTTAREEIRRHVESDE